MTHAHTQQSSKAIASAPRVSVVICAYTAVRWELTLKAIASVRRQSVPIAEIILVIDHNRALYERFCAHAPDLKVVENQQQKGLSGGRNTGIACSTGDIIGFLDDDAEADDDWIERMQGHFERTEVIGVGSRVEPSWIGVPRAWFPEEFLWVVGCTYRGLPETASPVRNLSGGSMLLRRQLFEQVGEFSHRLGRTESKLPLGGEETELCIRTQQAIPGSIFIYEPRTSIAHHVSTERMTWKYLALRCYAEGLTKATLSSMVGKGSLSSEKRQTLVVLPKGVLRGIADTLLRFDINGLARAGAIVLGFSCATLGFIIGSVLSRGSDAGGAGHEVSAGR